VVDVVSEEVEAQRIRFDVLVVFLELEQVHCDRVELNQSDQLLAIQRLVQKLYRINVSLPLELQVKIKQDRLVIRANHLFDARVSNHFVILRGAILEQDTVRVRRRLVLLVDKPVDLLFLGVLLHVVVLGALVGWQETDWRLFVVGIRGQMLTSLFHLFGQLIQLI